MDDDEASLIDQMLRLLTHKDILYDPLKEIALKVRRCKFMRSFRTTCAAKTAPRRWSINLSFYRKLLLPTKGRMPPM